MMGRNFFSLLIRPMVLFCVIHCSHADFGVHGVIVADMGLQKFQKDHLDHDATDYSQVADIAQLNQTVLELEYSLKKNISAHVKMGIQDQTSINFWDDYLFYTEPQEFRFLSAYAHMKIFNRVGLDLGLIPITTMYCAQADRHRFTIDPSIGHIVQGLDQKIGWNITAIKNPISLQAAVWNQRDYATIQSVHNSEFSDLNSFSALNGDWINTLIFSENYQNKTLNLGYSATLAFVPSDYDNIGSSMAISFLCSPLNQPYILATMGDFETDTSVGLSIYNDFFAYAARYLAYWNHVAIDLSLEYDYMGLEPQYQIGSKRDGSEVFQKDPNAYSYGALLAYSFSSERGYKIDPLTGRFAQKPKGLTLGCGFYGKTQKDIFALLSQIGQSDWVNSEYPEYSGSQRFDIFPNVSGAQTNQKYHLLTIDNTIPDEQDNPYAILGNLNPQGLPEHAFQIKSQTLTFIMNYQVNDFIEWKNELSYVRHKKVIFGQDYVDPQTEAVGAYVDSIYWMKTAILRSQLNVIF
jgi:hypothetical protein